MYNGNLRLHDQADVYQKQHYYVFSLSKFSLLKQLLIIYYNVVVSLLKRLFTRGIIATFKPINRTMSHITRISLIVFNILCRNQKTVATHNHLFSPYFQVSS